jgi:hypothetical protein
MKDKRTDQAGEAVGQEVGRDDDLVAAVGPWQARGEVGGQRLRVEGGELGEVDHGHRVPLHRRRRQPPLSRCERACV